MTDTVNVPREVIERTLALVNDMSRFVAAMALQDYAALDAVPRNLSTLLAAAPKAETFDELKPNDIACIIETYGLYNANGLYNASQLAEKIYRAFKDRAQPEAPKVEQEPFGYAYAVPNDTYVLLPNKVLGRRAGKALYTRPAPASEPLEALEDLTSACEAEFCSVKTEGESFTYAEPDEADVSYPSSHITFGHIRRARAAIAKHKGPQS